jgi:hypothetical protein
MPHSRVLACISCFFVLLWAYSSKGPLHDWAEAHPGWAATLVFVVPPIAAIFFD